MQLYKCTTNTQIFINVNRDTTLTNFVNLLFYTHSKPHKIKNVTIEKAGIMMLYLLIHFFIVESAYLTLSV